MSKTITKVSAEVRERAIRCCGWEAAPEPVKSPWVRGAFNACTMASHDLRNVLMKYQIYGSKRPLSKSTRVPNCSSTTDQPYRFVRLVVAVVSS
ncbi:hypothetical protein ACCS54_36020 [Rhizobium johnstonii]|jgi:hypothetical protein|uniref:Uncharacterized protein n=1 Tax=Rhizobium leguminosarum TaxID=384 RepID=A0A4V6MPX7_RHILE|nr:MULTISPECIES: hypothetical protein [Rhizobium]QIO56120.1 hypothetical protein HA461_33780 [Rhizobium leguminosarum bv. trifolii]QIO70430.1 hypothetical protein HA462_35955 [Rhizobium leguminosarum bv. trifolii]QIO77434.1 hypothetical protein HA459_36575 [Rhizobium leguminosarum bv. trifolii]QIO84453.1 hypothetical protein HA460_36610 [Rhizobium leguminosarum bv. trifolii]QJX09918.1 hypothetical protein RLCC275e_33635 [Rhizobium brockwellii]